MPKGSDYSKHYTALQEHIKSLTEQNQRLREALFNMVSVAEKDIWDKAISGRQLILADAKKALEEK